jgi:hypothetical protein
MLDAIDQLLKRWRFFVCASCLLACACTAMSQQENGQQISGVVVDAETKRPLNGVAVSAAFREKLAWWQRGAFTPEGPRRPRIADPRVTRTNATGEFDVEIVSWMEEMRQLGQETWPAEIFRLEYTRCGYEPVTQRVEENLPLRDSQLPLALGIKQRVEMHRAKPGSRYYSEGC